MNAPQSSPPDLACPADRFVEDVLSLPLVGRREAASEKTASAHYSNGKGNVRVEYFEGRPVKILLTLEGESDLPERAMVFLDSNGKVELVRSWIERTSSFDNGVRRGPSRRTISCVLKMRQDFSSDLRAREIADEPYSGVAGLHIHTLSFVGGMSHESANSFLGYSLDDSGVTITGERVADMTHFHGKWRIHISERKRYSGDAYVELPKISEIGTPPGLPTVTNGEASEGRLPYEVELFERTVSVSMGSVNVGEFFVHDVLDLDRYFRLLSPNRSSEARALEISHSVTDIVEWKAA